MKSFLASGVLLSCNMRGRRKPPQETTDLDDLLFWNNAFGMYLRDERLAQGLSLRQLEGQTGVSDSEIHKIETGSQECRLSSFIRISAALGIPPGLVLDQVISSSFAVFAGRIEGDPQFKELCEIRWKCDPALSEALTTQLANFCSVAAHLLRCSNATRKAESFNYPSDALRKAFLSFAAFADGVGSGLERANVLRMLQRAPIGELRNRGLLDLGFFDALALRAEELRLGKGGPISFWWPLPPPRTPFYSSYEASLHSEREAAAKPDLVAELQKRIDAGNYKRYLITPLMKKRLSWGDLRRRLRAVTRSRGSQAKLAARLKVTPQAVTEWLAGASAPTADRTLRILNLVEEYEAQQKQSAGALTPARETRRKSNYEKPSDRKKH